MLPSSMDRTGVEGPVVVGMQRPAVCHCSSHTTPRHQQAARSLAPAQRGQHAVRSQPTAAGLASHTATARGTTEGVVLPYVHYVGPLHQLPEATPHHLHRHRPTDWYRQPARLGNAHRWAPRVMLTMPMRRLDRPRATPRLATLSMPKQQVLQAADGPRNAPARARDLEQASHTEKQPLAGDEVLYMPVVVAPASLLLRSCVGWGTPSLISGRGGLALAS